jgi:hypothetical protein
MKFGKRLPEASGRRWAKTRAFIQAVHLWSQESDVHTSRKLIDGGHGDE